MKEGMKVREWSNQTQYWDGCVQSKSIENSAKRKVAMNDSSKSKKSTKTHVFTSISYNTIFTPLFSRFYLRSCQQNKCKTKHK